MSIDRFSPQLAAFVPLFYAAWSDAVLSPSEVQLIHQQINALSWLNAVDKKQLLQWSDPKNPPSDALLLNWLNLIKEHAQKSASNGRQQLVDIGIAMAKSSGSDMQWLTKETTQALQQLEQAIGLTSLEMHAHLLSQEQIKQEKEAILQQATVNTTGLQALLDDEYQVIRQKVFRVLQDPMFELNLIRNKEEYREQVLQWCQLIADQGFGALHFPEAYGGKNDMGAFSAVFETLGYHDLSLVVKFGVQFGLWGGAVLWLGTDKHHQRYLHDIGNLSLPGCFAMTETGHGSNVRDCETTATYDPKDDSIIVHSPNISSGKDYIGNAAAHGQMAAVFAQLIVHGENHGVHAILVPLRTKNGIIHPGVKIEDCAYKLGLNGVDNGRIWFDHVRVPRFNLLNKFGNIDENGRYSSPIKSEAKRFFTMLGTLVGGRLCVPRAGLSAAKSSLTIAVKYALKRRQFGPEGEAEMLIMDYPSHQRRLMPRLAKAYALDFALTYLTKRFCDRTEADMRTIETLAAALKSAATWFASDTIQACREACGGKGYLAENRFADFKADSDIFTTFEGDNTVLMQLVAKGVLSDFNKEITEDGWKSMLSFATTRLADTIREKNFIHSNNIDEEHLCSSAFQLASMEYRLRDLSISVGQRLRKYIARGIDPHQAFLKCQLHLLAVAQAYVDHLVLEQFVQQVQACTNSELQQSLKLLCDLYALDTLEKNKGWYLEQGCMSGSKTRAIRRQVDKLCKKVRNNAAGYVDAFGIPAHCLAAPIASYS